MLGLIIAGILQGVLEWLPVSSQGIISLFLANIGYTLEQAVDISLFLHVGTLIATIHYFWKDSKKIVVPKSRKNVNILLFILWSSFISLLIGGPLYLSIPFLSGLLSEKIGLLIGSFLIITGIIQLFRKSFSSRSYADVKRSDGIINGAAQGFSALPGISRSGSTTLALLVQGFSIDSALKLSFFSSIPIIFLVQLYSGVKNGFFLDAGYLLAAFTAFVVGRLSIDYFLKIAKKFNFALFCIIFGLLNVAITIFL